MIGFSPKKTIEPSHTAQLWKERAKGLLAPVTLCLACVASLAGIWPDEALFGTFARMLDSLAPQILGISLLLAVALVALGARFVAFCVVLISSLGAAGIIALHLSLASAALPTEPTVLTGLWFNMYFKNDISPARLADAIQASESDLVVVSEARNMQPLCEALQITYPYRLRCGDPGSELLAFSRYPFVPGSIKVIDMSRPGRLLQMQLDVPGTPGLSVVAAHMTKPWFYGFVETDRWFLQDALSKLSGPVIVMGDFNAAPWSQPQRRLMAQTRLAPLRWPVATWPVAAGPLGVPIDQVLTRGNIAVRQQAAWGADLGSNHLGLRTEFALRP